MKTKHIISMALAVAAVFAINVIAVASASASSPEFKPGTAQLFTTSSGEGTLENSLGAEKVYCSSDTSHGEVTGSHTVGNVVVTFHNCTGKASSGTCTAKSSGGTPGTITTGTLKGELGTVKTSEAASGVGLLLAPVTGSFVTLEGSCLTTAAVSGSIAGEVTPLNTLSTTGKLIYAGSSGTQTIQSITVLGKVEKPALTAFAGLVSASEATNEAVLFTSAVEVT
jgi:hypothetical protein